MLSRTSKVSGVGIYWRLTSCVTRPGKRGGVDLEFVDLVYVPSIFIMLLWALLWPIKSSSGTPIAMQADFALRHWKLANELSYLRARSGKAHVVSERDRERRIRDSHLFPIV